MDKQTKETLMDIAAEIVVSPLTFYVKLRELKEEFDASSVGARTNEKINTTREKAASKAKEVSTKVSESDAAKKVKTAYENIKESADGLFGRNSDVIDACAEDVPECGQEEAEETAAPEEAQEETEEADVQEETEAQEEPAE